MHLVETVLAGENEGFGQIVTGDHLTFLLRLVQKFPGTLGGGGVVQIEDTNDALLPDSHIVAYRKIHDSIPFCRGGS